MPGIVENKKQMNKIVNNDKGDEDEDDEDASEDDDDDDDDDSDDEEQEDDEEDDKDNAPDEKDKILTKPIIQAVIRKPMILPGPEIQVTKKHQFVVKNGDDEEEDDDDEEEDDEDDDDEEEDVEEEEDEDDDDDEEEQEDDSNVATNANRTIENTKMVRKAQQNKVIAINPPQGAPKLENSARLRRYRLNLE